MKNLFYLSGAIAFALISFYFATIQMKSNSETCKYLAEEIDNYINLSGLSKSIAKMESTDKAKYSPHITLSPPTVTPHFPLPRHHPITPLAIAPDPS